MPLDPSSPAGTVLVIDDDPDVRASAELLLNRRGYRMLGARGPAEAWSALAAAAVDVILLDLNFSPRATTGAEGLGLLRDIMRHDPHAVVVVVTGHSGINIAVAAIRAGAADFVMKPWSNDRLIATLDEAIKTRRGRLGEAARAPATAGGEAGVILGGAAMAGVRDLIARAASLPAPVLIHGEAGTGKSLIAQAIHRGSARAGAPLIVLDLAAAPSEGEAAFFDREVAGAFEAAMGGDLVLDEIGALSPFLQSRLLALIEARTRGPAAPRLISITARPRASLEAPGGPRPDLLVRLNTVEIWAPPLRDRGEDIGLLAEHFLGLYGRRYGRPPRALSPAAAQVLARADWPGNVRALRQTLERVVILTDGSTVDVAELHTVGLATETVVSPPAAPTLALSERALIEAALNRRGFNVSQAAADLGLTRASLYRRMAKHGL
jgi:DNA-binding NtrC family response regulator